MLRQNDHNHTMEQWQDQGIILSSRKHGESGAIVSLLTRTRGRYVGYVRGAQGTKMRGVLEIGNSVDVAWQSRVAENMGTYALELSANAGVHLLHDPLRLSALQAVCALCDAAMPEREAHEGLFDGTLALFEAMKNEDIWAAAYVMWEIAFLRELGFSLDLSKCAAGSGDDDLIYVSPKTGRAVSRSAGAPYKEKLLSLPAFLTPRGGDIDDIAIDQALQLTGFFFEHWAFTHHSRGIPDARLRFAERFAKTIKPADTVDSKDLKRA